MTTGDPREVLKRLRDEVYDCYRAAPGSALRHALMIRPDPPMTRDEETRWWEGIARFVGWPLLGAGASAKRRYPRPENVAGHVLTPLAHFFGEAGDLAVLRRFVNQCRRVMGPAEDALGRAGLPYFHPGEAGDSAWPLACYFARWDRLPGIDYDVKTWGWPDDGDVYGQAPVTTFVEFVEWEERKRVVKPGVYFAVVEADVRIATVQVIDAVLSMAAATTPPPGVPPAWFTASKAELLRFHGKTERYTAYLDVLKKDQQLDWRDAPTPVGFAAFEFRYSDPLTHAAAWRQIKVWRADGH